ncbi:MULTISPECIES: hypothetical protein [Aeromonas]|uniref:hypothetical protein n=1 Tax=Aeromonas TaxID=642 RepID=UPI000F77D945|nr:hypothetical protein [Aeromonas salmonicida]RSM32291.1 hypothetical protein C5B78_00995 [Aeromonas salmonicida]
MDFTFLKEMSFAQFISFLAGILPFCYVTWVAMKKRVQVLEEKINVLEQGIALEKQQSRLETDMLKDGLRKVEENQDRMVTKMDANFADIQRDIKLLLQK